MIRNRGDCCQERLSHFRVTIGNNVNGDDNAVCMADGGNTVLRKDIEVHCDPPLEGRYVEIMVPGDDKEFTLCEVLVLEFDRKYFIATKLQLSLSNSNTNGTF